MNLKGNKPSKYYLQYTGLSLQMVIIMGLATWLGKSLDQHYQLSFPWFLSFFSVSSTILCIYLTIQKLTHQHDKEAQ